MTTPTKQPSLLARAYAVLSNPATVRNDIAYILGLVAFAVAAVAPTWHMPVLPDAILGAGGVLLAAVVRLVHTLVDGHGLSADVADIRAALPDVRNALSTVVPFIETEVPGLRSTIQTASAAASTAVSTANAAMSSASAAQAAIQPLANLAAGTAAPTAPVAAPVTAPAT